MSHTNFTGNHSQLPPHHQPTYTTYEKQLLSYIYDGLSIKQLAARLGVSKKAIEKSRKILFQKARVHNIILLIRHALRTQLIIDPLIKNKTQPN